MTIANRIYIFSFENLIGHLNLGHVGTERRECRFPALRGGILPASLRNLIGQSEGTKSLPLGS